MRVISGRFGGRKLVSFRADHIRPTTDRVKETIFNKLQFHLEGSRFLDLFSGTGSIAIEALSRGAAYVQAVEKHPKSLEILNQNLKLLGIGKEIHVICKDVFLFLRAYDGPPFDIILADPPFTEKIAHEVMDNLSNSVVWGPETLIFIESGKQEKIVDEYGSLGLVDRKNFGDKMLSIFQRKAHDAEGDLSG